MTPEEQVLVHSHNYGVVVLSVVISILAAYAALDLSERIRDARGRAWLGWLAGGAVAHGIGTWSMHYTGMLALRLPIPFWFDWPTVALSLLMGILGSAAALFVLSRNTMGWLWVLAASIFLGGVGISGLHYTAMAAMRLQAMQHYSPPLVTLSVVLAIMFSWLSLAPTFLVRDDTPGRRLRNHASAVLRGLANPVLHYTAMAAVTFMRSSQPPDVSHSVSISSLGIIGISIVPVMILIVALLTSLIDRLQKQRALLDELFEQAPQAIALLRVDHRVVRVNREFTRLFGYTPQEARGRRLSELIVPDEARDQEQRYADVVAHGERVDVEVVGQHKDGSRLHVSMIRVPVSVPGGQIEIYAIYRDITERKQAEAERARLYEQVRASRAQLQLLSRQLLNAQEAERGRVARELHDEAGQALTALKISLGLLRADIPPDHPTLHQRLNAAIALTQTTMEQVRFLAQNLRPPTLDEVGLNLTLEEFCRDFADRTRLRIAYRGADLPALPAEVDICCYRFVQEALTNVAKHAHASQVWVTLHADAATLTVVVEDDGQGFDPQVVFTGTGQFKGIGLLGIQERVAALGGQLTIRSRLPHGASLTVQIPIQEDV